jgi:hypothetical protein
VVPWLVAGLGLVLAIVALTAARRVSRRVDTLTQSYWELRYEYTRLRSRMARLDPEDPGAAADPEPAVQASSSVTFVPLSTIRKPAPANAPAPAAKKAE